MTTAPKPTDAAPLEYATPAALDPRDPPPPPRRWWRLPWAVVGGTVLFLLLLVSILLPQLGRVGPEAMKIISASNLRQIGQAMLLYANANGDQYPPDLDPLLQGYDLTPRTLVIYGSSDTPAAGATPAAVVADLRAGGHCSYVYCGRGRSSKGPAAEISAFEARSYFGDGGRNFLYGDGSAAYLDAAAANHAINELAAGHNPPRP